jgi:hypothetical protein
MPVQRRRPRPLGVSDGAVDVRHISQHGRIIARLAKGGKLSHVWILPFADQLTDVSPRWITTAHGHQTVYLILPSRTSSAFYSLLWSAWATWKLCSGNVDLLFGAIETCLVWVNPYLYWSKCWLALSTSGPVWGSFVSCLSSLLWTVLQFSPCLYFLCAHFMLSYSMSQLSNHGKSRDTKPLCGGPAYWVDILMPQGAIRSELRNKNFHTILESSPT